MSKEGAHDAGFHSGQVVKHNGLKEGWLMLMMLAFRLDADLQDES